MSRLYQSQQGWDYLRKRPTHSGYIRKRRAVQAAGVHGRRLSALMAARALPIARPVSRSVGENKYIDIAHASYANDTTGSVTHLSVVPQGDSVNSRDGRKFMLTNVNIRGWIEQNSTAVWNNPVNLLVWDKQPNKALAAITDILDSIHPSSQNKRENASRFMILRRWDMVLTGKNDGSTVSGFARNFDKFVRFPWLDCRMHSFGCDRRDWESCNWCVAVCHTWWPCSWYELLIRQCLSVLDLRMCRHEMLGSTAPTSLSL